MNPGRQRSTACLGATAPVCGRFGRLGVVFVVLTLLHCVFADVPARAQLLRRPLAIRNARILTMDGAVIEDGTLVIKGEKIVAVGADVKPPLLARKIDAAGGTVTPGLIDAYSALGSSAAGGGSVTRRAEDAFDRYDTANLQEALRHGVTTVFLSPGNSAGTRGTGAILRLAPTSGGADCLGRVLKSEAALCLSLGSEGKPIARLKTFAAAGKQFQDALDHRKALEDYKEDLAEYEKKLKEWLAKKEKEKSKEGEKATPKDGRKPQKDGKPAAKMAAAEAKPKEDKPEEEEKKDQEKKEEGGKPKKPQRPARKPHLDIVLKALDREMPVRILAHRSEDILNALELVEQFSFDLILEGAAEAHLVAEELAEAKVLVILGHTPRSGIRRDDVYRRAAQNTGRVLSAAGVRWVAGSGAADTASARFVAMNSQLAAAHGGCEDPLKTVTAEAADVLRAADRIGRLRPGLLADLVIWSGDPLSPASEVRQVYVGGALVFEATQQTEKGGGK